jgi:hypothetical protein
MQDAVANARAGRKGWTGPDLARHESTWLTHFTSADLEEIDSALKTFRASGREITEMTRAQFPLPGMQEKLHGYMEEIRNGRGFVVLRGLPVERYSDDDAGAIFFGLGLYLGEPLVQNPMGDVLGHVYDQGRPYGQLDVRGYETNALLPFHTDGCEMVGLLCLRKAKRGGLSSISSSVAVYREIERTRPDLLQPLFDGYRYIRREAALTAEPVSPPISVYGEKDGVVSCRFVPTQIEAAAQALKQPIEGRAREALDLLVALTRDERFRLDMDLQRGDIQLVNNYTVLHSRTEYEDFPEPERKRHMLRLWLAFDEAWPLPANFPRQLGYNKGQLAERHLA